MQRYLGANTLSSTVRYILANSGTYLYFSDERLSKQSLQTVNSTCPLGPGTAACALTLADFSQPWDGGKSPGMLSLHCSNGDLHVAVRPCAAEVYAGVMTISRQHACLAGCCCRIVILTSLMCESAP